MITQERAEQAHNDSEIITTQILTARGSNKKKLIQKRAGLLAVVTRYNRQAVAHKPVENKKAPAPAVKTSKAADDVENAQLNNIAKAYTVLLHLQRDLIVQAQKMIDDGATEQVIEALDTLLNEFSDYNSLSAEVEEAIKEDEVFSDKFANSTEDMPSSCNHKNECVPLCKELNPLLYGENRLFRVVSVRISQ